MKDMNKVLNQYYKESEQDYLISYIKDILKKLKIKDIIMNIKDIINYKVINIEVFETKDIIIHIIKVINIVKKDIINQVNNKNQGMIIFNRKLKDQSSMVSNYWIILQESYNHNLRI